MAKPASGTALDSGNALYSHLTNVWALLEGTGSTTADSKGSNTGTLSGTVAWATDGVGPYLTKASSGGKVSLGSAITINPTGSFSIAFRAAEAAADLHGMVFGQPSTTNNFVWLANGAYLGYRHNGADVHNTSLTTFTTNANYLLVYDSVGHTFKTYKNGSLNDTQSVNLGGNGNATFDALMDGYTSNSFDLVGRLDYLYTMLGYAASSTDATNLNTDPYSIFSSSASAVVTEQNLPANHNGNITVHLVGTGTSWTSSTTWTPSGVSGWSVASKTRVSGTAYTVVLTPPVAATPPAGATGTLTLTEGVTGSTAPTTTVGTPSFTRSPTSGAPGTTPTLTLTGTNTIWASETAAGLFTVSGGTGASLATPTVTTNTAATDVLTVGSAAGTLTITDASTGATVTFTATAGTIAITAPVAHQFRWRGAGGTASLTISGTYTGSPTSIEWSSDGSTWATLDASPSAGAYTGSVSLATGQYTISTRFSNSTPVIATVTPVSVAYVLAVAGQSNASGRGTNNQTVYDNTFTDALKTATGYATLADPYGVSVDGSSGGSFVPAMVSELANLLGAPIGIVPAAVGSTSITDWQSGQARYIYLVAAVTAVGGCDAVLFWQGEQDAFAGMSQTTYHTNLAAFVASVQSDLVHPVIQCLLQTADEYSQAAQDAINAAITAGWSDISGLKRGPDLRPIPTEPESNVHLMTDAKLCQAGAMWAGWVYKDLFQPAGGSGGLQTARGFTGGIN